MIYLGIYLLGVIISIGLYFVYLPLYKKYNPSSKESPIVLIIAAPLSWISVLIEIFCIITLLL